MAKYRNIQKLVEAIKKEVPDMWHYRTKFNMALEDVLDSANYRAPEAYVVNFEQLAMVLSDHIGEPDEPWKKRIADIFNGITEVKGMTYFEI